jgi:Spy/CpxP family protein refolding chaperone
MRRSWLLALLVVSVAVNGAVAFHALGRGLRGGAGMPGEPPLFRAVRLDEAQRTAILERRGRLLARREATAAELAGLRGDLAEALALGEAGRGRIDAVLAKMEAAQRDYQRAVVEHLLGVRETLTPEQRPVFERMLAERLREGWVMQPDGMVLPGGAGGAR